ncbi:hypothetical protein [Azohydromonas sp.]|uniref:hypothetical protein n=1 Tax=Azohydromonas sp. TaxID=1872666 RepID=UPI002B7D8168|nr:hypothetical protein [Azohydromonas sp.]HMM87099.1 hypothetical protein [Azohydromonas sp.]
MQGGLTIDPEASHLVTRCWAVVAVRRGSRKRFAETCVEPMPSAEAALAAADPAHHRHAAEVMGPSRSSEGVRLYYLVRWLDPA